MHNTALPLISIKMMSWNKERKVWGKFDQEIFSIIYGFFTFTFTLICYFKFDFHFYLVFALSLSREEGLKRGFAALDAENTGRIPVDKFKRRLREVLNNDTVYLVLILTFVFYVCFIATALHPSFRVCACLKLKLSKW